jgi:catechol 2,3-dioxygenase-like lactoylglutathione lyase family enzyme
MTQAVTQKNSLFTGAFSSFSVNRIDEAKQFYGETLGLEVTETAEGLSLGIPNGEKVFLYPKQDHQPAVFTVFNLFVKDIAQAVEELTKRGIKFLQYDEPIKTDDKGIFWGGKQGKGPNIAWFKDPAQNILSIIEK